MNILNKNYAKVNDLFPGVYFSANLQKNITFISPAAKDTHKFSNLTDLYNISLKNLLFIDDKQYNVFVEEFDKNGYVNNYVIKSKTTQGYFRYLRLNARLLTDDKGVGIGMEGFFKDITEDVVSGTQVDNTIKTIKLSDNKELKLIRLLVDSSNDIIFVKNAEGKYLFVNKAFSQLAGINPNSIVGMSNKDLLNDMNSTALEQFAVLELNEVRMSYLKVSLPGGIEDYYLPEIKQAKLPEQDKSVLIVIAHNVTTLVKADMAMTQINQTLTEVVQKRTADLQKSKKTFETLFEKGSEIKFLTRKGGTIVHANEKAVEITIGDDNDISKYNITDILGKGYSALKPKIVAEIEEKGAFVFESKLKVRKGGYIWVEVSVVQIFYEGEKAYYFTARDITERKEYQKNILKAILKTEEDERNRFAKELHDGLGTLISAVKMYIDLLIQKDISEEKNPAILQSMKDLIDEAALSAKEIANNIKPHMLSNFGLILSIKDLINKRANVERVEMKFFHSNFSGKLNDDIELSVYRMISELINNTFKYANASELRIVLRLKNSTLTVMYSDNGKGFDMEKIKETRKGGSGIKNIMARTENIQGKLSFAAIPGKGVFLKLKYKINDFVLL